MYDLKQALDNPFIAVSSRPKRYIENPVGILPVSCTVIDVKDSCYKPLDGCHELETIFGSWGYVGRGLKTNAGVAVNLSNLRPKGTRNAQNMDASGPVSFMPMYSEINLAIRQGNAFKNGAITLFLDSTHPDFLEYLALSARKLPGAYKAAYVGEEIFAPENEELLNAIIAHILDGDLFLAKRRYDRNGVRLFSNVCMEVAIRSRATCNITPVNLGMIRTLDELVPAFVDTMTFLCELHKQSNLECFYLSREEDRQVAMGVIGLGNLLANFGVTYEEFVVALALVFDDVESDRDALYDFCGFDAYKLAVEFFSAYDAASKVAKKYNMDRAFAIAPTASVSYNYKDYNGFTCTPEIMPLISHPETHISRRERDGEQKTFQYPMNVELAHYNVSWDTYFNLARYFQKLQDIHGLGHAISFNFWNRGGCEINRETLRRWYDSNLWSTYYRHIVDGAEGLDKTNIGIEVSEEDAAFWGGTDCDILDKHSGCDCD